MIAQIIVIICLIKFGGMSKRNKESKKTNNLHRYFTSNQTSQGVEVPTLQNKNQCKKKVNPNLNQPIVTNLQPKRPNLLHFLKNTQIRDILSNCPKICSFAKQIHKKTKLQEELVLSLLQKCLASGQHSLWASKYRPCQIVDLFNVQVGTTIKNWINAFFQYKNIISEEGILDEEFDEKSSKLMQSVAQNQWKLMALVVMGRPGIGKSSAIRAIAKQMDIQLQQCGNQYNQTKYLKEKNESTQSESVKTVMSRTIKLQKDTQMITKFIPTVQKEKPRENRKSQLIHNVGDIQPQSQAGKFYTQLVRCINQSKIPFIMTNSRQKLPKQCQKYDIIEYQQGSLNKIEQTLWVIFHLQKFLKLDKYKQIEKQNLFLQLNFQTQLLQFEQQCSFATIGQVCNLFDNRLDYIFTFLQNNPNLASVNFYNLLVEKYSKLGHQAFLNSIGNMKFSQLKLQMPNQLLYKVEEVTLQSQQASKEVSIAHYKQQLNILRIQDSTRDKQQQVFGEQRFIQPFRDNPYRSVDIKIHRQIKQNLVDEVINYQINSSSEKIRSTLKASQLQYLPMLVRQRRSSRNSKHSTDILKKYFNENEYIYLKQYGHMLNFQ